MDLVTEFDLDLLALARHPHVRAAELAQKVQRRLGLLAQRQSKGVLLAALTHGRLHVIGEAVETIRRTGTGDALVRTLVVVVGDPVRQTLGGIRKRREDRVGQEFRPDRLPEALDLAQRHRMVRRAAHMVDALALQ